MDSRRQEGTGQQGLPHRHVPVLLSETIKALNVLPGGRYVDCTLGSGGHASAILEASAPGGQLLGIDADPKAIEETRQRLFDFRSDILLVNDNFANLERVCADANFYPVNGILFDLGLSSRQLEADGRGFSFQHESPLDMRFDPAQELTAADIVNGYSEKDLSDLIFQFGEDPSSRQIARQIVASRPMRTTLELAGAITRATGRGREKIHPATRTFQALRIAVNQELRSLSAALTQAIGLLGFQGRLVVISYHSLEDRIVKNLLRHESTECICPPVVLKCACGHVARLRLATKKAITPSQAEVLSNPRSRSARLRTAERI
ncbi:MAG: 16S rRNA (cytosine(1402)-N(4))-methyltransferase RsmH [Dehalococcoidia bacterium]|nr:16S rRNA (cytosine(1402)-N(4))-methyltransferase RsmH [Dehalococcoidia bacterium]